METFILNTSP